MEGLREVSYEEDKGRIFFISLPILDPSVAG